MKKALAIMFVVVGGLAAFIYYSQKSASDRLVAKHDKIYEEIFHRPMDIASASRGDVEDTLGIRRVMQNYNEEKYTDALQEMDQFLNNHPDIFQVKFYRGITHLELNDPNKAIQDFQDVMSLPVNNESQWYNTQAEWYLALAYLKQNNVEQAKAVLESIVSKNNAQSEASKSVLDQIES